MSEITENGQTSKKGENGTPSLGQWTPSSWKDSQKSMGTHSVTYKDAASFVASITKLSSLPPLVTSQEILKLKSLLREVALGNAFLLQGGDCAELFDYCRQDAIESKVKLLLQMSLVLIYGAKKKVVRIARMAGQFAKPRSSPHEVVDGVSMASFRGDILNSYTPDPVARKPDPKRLVDAYFHSAATLNYLRAAIGSGLADLHSPLDWGLGHVQDPEVREKYEGIVNTITEWLAMMQTIGVGNNDGGLESIDLFTSHEGLLLEYEQALLRPYICTPRNQHQQPSQNGTFASPHPPTPSPAPAYYASSAHFLWIGDRTRSLTGAHVEFFRGLSNPIGIKVGPTMPPQDLPPLLDILDPHNEPGKITLITRYGAEKIHGHLPAHIAAVRGSGHTVVWQCDPMHGNTRNAAPSPGQEGEPKGPVVKTRAFSSILAELQAALDIHREAGSCLGGVHLELTGEAVTECVGGAGGLRDEDLSLNYTSFCDPRLNEKQALELAFLVAGFYRGEKKQQDGGKGVNGS